MLFLVLKNVLFSFSYFYFHIWMPIFKINIVIVLNFEACTFCILFIKWNTLYRHFINFIQSILILWQNSLDSLVLASILATFARHNSEQVRAKYRNFSVASRSIIYRSRSRRRHWQFTTFCNNVFNRSLVTRSPSLFSFLNRSLTA